MKTTYANVKHPDRLGWVLGIAALVGFAVYIALVGIQQGFWFWFRMFVYLLAIFCVSYLPFATVKCTVDDEEETLFTPENKKSPIMVKDIDRITRVTNRKGRLRYLNIHEAGVRFVDVRLLPARSDALVAQLTSLNPAIKVETRSYF